MGKWFEGLNLESIKRDALDFAKEKGLFCWEYYEKRDRCRMYYTGEKLTQKMQKDVARDAATCVCIWKPKGDIDATKQTKNESVGVQVGAKSASGSGLDESAG